MSRAHSSLLFILAICIALSGCRGLVSTGPANQIHVTLNQYFASLGINANTQFAATVTGTTNTNVTWSVDKIAGGNSTVGTITAAALYSAPPQAGTHTVTVTSAADPTKTATATVTVLDFLLSPLSAMVAPGATQQFSTAIPVNWSVDGVAGGNGAAGTINSSGMYTAPLATGAHSITATSTANPALSASAALTVINSSPGAVLTYHNNNARDGAFTEETVLIPSNIGSAHFGKLLSYPVDGQIYAQPLYLPQVSIAGANHDVVFVATENNSVYAFDAKGSQVTPLWTKSLGTATPRNDLEGVSPLLGITSTPVIDVTTGTLYVLAENTNAHFQLHALDITSGAEKFGGPVTVTGSVSGTGLDNAGGTITLENSCYQRMGLALNPVTNMIYLAFGHCNHGWILAYDKTTLQLTATFNDTPDGAGGGLWAGGGAPAIDDVTGDLYLITGVDQNDPSSGYNDAFLRLSGKDLSVLDFFQPDNEAFLRANDADLGAGATILMPDDSSGSPRETIGGGKDGRVFVVNRDSMGSFSPTADNVFEIVQTGVQQFDNIFSTPVYWNGSLYYHCESDVLHAFSWSNGLLSTQPVSSGNSKFAMHGATPSLSSNGMQNGIIWEIDNTNYGSGPAVLHAYDATNVGNELYNSSQAGSRDTAGMALKFTVPTIAGGKVFVPTANELDIYGLLGP
jgi:PQQ-like domain